MATQHAKSAENLDSSLENDQSWAKKYPLGQNQTFLNQNVYPSPRTPGKIAGHGTPPVYNGNVFCPEDLTYTVDDVLFFAGLQCIGDLLQIALNAMCESSPDEIRTFLAKGVHEPFEKKHKV